MIGRVADARILELGATAVYADVMAAAPEGCTARVYLGDAVCGVSRAVDDPGWARYCNRVVGLGIVEPATPDLVDGACAVYRAAGVPFAVRLSALARPAALPAWLEECGLAPLHMTGMYCRAIDPLVTAAGTADSARLTDLRVAPVARDDAGAWAAPAGGTTWPGTGTGPWPAPPSSRAGSSAGLGGRACCLPIAGAGRAPRSWPGASGMPLPWVAAGSSPRSGLRRRRGASRRTTGCAGRASTSPTRGPCTFRNS